MSAWCQATAATAHMFVSAAPACNCFSGWRSQCSTSTRSEPVLGMLRQQSASEGKASYVGHSHNPCPHSDHQCQDQVDLLLHDMTVSMVNSMRLEELLVRCGQRRMRRRGRGVPVKNPFIWGEIKTFFLHQLEYPASSPWHCHWLAPQ